MTESAINDDTKRTSTSPDRDLVHLHGKERWSWSLGIVLVVLGIMALSLIAIRSLDSIPWLAWLLVLAGIAEAVHAFHLRKSSAFFFHVVPGIAGLPLGLLVATHSGLDLFSWMLVFAYVFTIIGLFRLLSAIRLRFPSWRWAVFDAIVTLVIGCVFWSTSPGLAQWFFDLAVGISLILRGWSSAMFGLTLGRRRDDAAQNQVPGPKSTEPGRSAHSYRFQVNHFR